MDIPKLPKQTSPFLWGAATGAVALAITGFSWGGWVTGGTAEKLAAARADEVMVASLVPICVAQFQRAPGAPARLVAFKEVKSWEQGDYVSTGGWATMPGSLATEPNRQVAQACAEALARL
jgi:hypothetical protein